MRVIALLATYNEELFIGSCIDHLIRQGVEVYLIDNASTDGTVDLARARLGSGLLDIENFPRGGDFAWQPILGRKAELTSELTADWFIHVDADEIRLSPDPSRSLSDALEEADRSGYNAVNFMEYTFLPTLESPHHENPEFETSMRAYYPFLPAFPHRLSAWKHQPGRVDLISKAGHQVRFPDLRMYPESFPMRHYLFLSLEHAHRKYVDRTYDREEVARGWHRKRSALRAEDIRLPSDAEMRPYHGDEKLDPQNPLTAHLCFLPTSNGA